MGLWKWIKSIQNFSYEILTQIRYAEDCPCSLDTYHRGSMEKGDRWDNLTSIKQLTSHKKNRHVDRDKKLFMSPTAWAPSNQG